VADTALLPVRGCKTQKSQMIDRSTSKKDFQNGIFFEILQTGIVRNSITGVAAEILLTGFERKNITDIVHNLYERSITGVVAEIL
jgi:hypothetical protein